METALGFVRVTAACKMRVKDFEDGDDAWLLLHEKGSQVRRNDLLAMVKRRCADAALPTSICNHSFRATAITIYQENGGRVEDSQALAGHADMRTTQLNNRKRRKLQHAEVDRVQL
jgi:integrase